MDSNTLCKAVHATSGHVMLLVTGLGLISYVIVCAILPIYLDKFLTYMLISRFI